MEVLDRLNLIIILNDVQIEGVRRYEVVDLEEGVNKTVQMTLENGKMTYPDGSFSTKSKTITKYITYEERKEFLHQLLEMQAALILMAPLMRWKSPPHTVYKSLCKRTDA